MSQLRFQSRSEASGPPVVPIPALEQKISILPAAPVTVSTKNLTWSSLDTSQAKNAPRPSSISWSTLNPLSSSTSAQATRRAPSLANLRQSARPIPLAPPVTTTTFPLRSEEHTSELQSRQYLVCRLLLEKKKTTAECSRMTFWFMWP